MRKFSNSQGRATYAMEFSHYENRSGDGAVFIDSKKEIRSIRALSNPPNAMRHSSFSERVCDRFDNHPLRVRFRQNEMATGEMAPYVLPDFKDIRRFLENVLIAVPGTPLILLHILATESVGTLREKTRGRSDVVLKERPFWDRDYSEISPVSQAIESGYDVPVTHSMNGKPHTADGINRATREFARIK